MHNLNEVLLDEIKTYLSNEPPESSVYIGVDSERYNKKVSG